MVAKNAATRLSSAALPSVTVPALAEKLGVSVETLGEYIKMGLLTCHLLLHEQNGEIPKPPEMYVPGPGGGHMGTYQPPPEQVPLDGYYRLPTRWAAAAFDGGSTAPSVIVGEGESARFVQVPSIRPTRCDLRVMREEVERFERELVPAELIAPHRRTPAMRDSARHRERCRAVAAVLWRQDPGIRIAQMANRDEIIRDACEGESRRRQSFRRRYTTAGSWRSRGQIARKCAAASLNRRKPLGALGVGRIRQRASEGVPGTETPARVLSNQHQRDAGPDRHGLDLHRRNSCLANVVEVVPGVRQFPPTVPDAAHRDGKKMRSMSDDAGGSEKYEAQPIGARVMGGGVDGRGSSEVGDPQSSRGR